MYLEQDVEITTYLEVKSSQVKSSQVKSSQVETDGAAVPLQATQGYGMSQEDDDEEAGVRPGAAEPDGEPAEG
jgi:hypothetical protein